MFCLKRVALISLHTATAVIDYAPLRFAAACDIVSNVGCISKEVMIISDGQAKMQPRSIFIKNMNACLLQLCFEDAAILDTCGRKSRRLATNLPILLSLNSALKRVLCSHMVTSSN